MNELKQKRVYIAGKITGDRNYKIKFSKTEETLRREGNIVLNPASLPEGMTAAEYMRLCFCMIDMADMVVFLPDFTKSQGAMLEFNYCVYIGKSRQIRA